MGVRDSTGANVTNHRRDWLPPTVKDTNALGAPDNAQDRTTVSSGAFALLAFVRCQRVQATSMLSHW